MTPGNVSNRDSSTVPPGETAGADFAIFDHAFRGEAEFETSDDIRLWGYLAPVVGEVTVGARHHPRRVYHREDLRMTEPGVEIRRAADEHAVIRCFSIPQRVFSDALGVCFGSVVAAFAPLQRFAFQSPLIGCVTEQLSADDDDRRRDPAYVDAMLHAVAHELRRLAGAQQPSLADGRLSAAELRRLDQFIDGALGARLKLRDLAGALRMPVSAFQKAIKRTTGRTAYQHLLQRRLCAARRLLETSEASLAQIAFQTGFTSQSHMTDVFKAKLGATPGRLRLATRA